MVAILAALLRLGLFTLAIISPGRIFATDSYSYLNPAMALLETGYYSHPITIATPTYPVFIAGVYSLFGENPLYIVTLQIILGVGTLFLTYRLGRLLAISPGSSLIAALLLSLSLESLLSPFFILTDTLFTFLLISATCALVAFIHRQRWLWLVWAAILTGMTILCRPVAIAYEAVVILILSIIPYTRFGKRALYSFVHLLLVVILFIAPWVWRNQQVTGMATFTSKSGYYWLSWSAAPLYADLHKIPVDQAEAELLTRVDDLLRQRGLEPDEANLSAAKDEVAREILLAHPVHYAFLHLRYDLQNFLPELGYAVKYLQLAQGDTQGMEVLQSQGWAAVIENYFGGKLIDALIFAPFILILLLTYTGTLTGVIDTLRKRQWLVIAVLLLTAGYFLLVPGYASNSRYRIPAMPFLALFAGIGLEQLWGLIKKRSARKGHRRP